MVIKMVSNSISDNIEVDGVSEVGLSYEDKLNFFNKIYNKLPEVNPKWFHFLLKGLCENLGEFNVEDGNEVFTLEL